MFMGLAVIASSVAQAITVPLPPPPIMQVASVEHAPSIHDVPPDTQVRLMVLREVTSRTATVGDRIRLRVDEAVTIGGRVLIPIGASAWGEIVSLEKNGAAGKGGALGARLLYIDMPDGSLPITGDLAEKAGGNGTGLGLAVLSFGIFGLLNAGDSARFKAGHTFTAFTRSAPRAGLEAQIVPQQILEIPVR